MDCAAVSVVGCPGDVLFNLYIVCDRGTLIYKHTHTQLINGECSRPFEGDDNDDEIDDPFDQRRRIRYSCENRERI